MARSTIPFREAGLPALTAGEVQDRADRCTKIHLANLKASPAFQSHQARERRVVVLTCAFALLALLAFICTTSLVATSAAGTLVAYPAALAAETAVVHGIPTATSSTGTANAPSTPAPPPPASICLEVQCALSGLLIAPSDPKPTPSISPTAEAAPLPAAAYVDAAVTVTSLWACTSVLAGIVVVLHLVLSTIRMFTFLGDFLEALRDLERWTKMTTSSKRASTPPSPPAQPACCSPSPSAASSKAEAGCPVVVNLHATFFSSMPAAGPPPTPAPCPKETKPSTATVTSSPRAITATPTPLLPHKTLGLPRSRHIEDSARRPSRSLGLAPSSRLSKDGFRNAPRLQLGGQRTHAGGVAFFASMAGE